MSAEHILSGALTSVAIPTQLLIQPVQAWALLMVLLAVSCGVLWFLTRPRDTIPTEPAHSPTRPGRGRTHRQSPRRTLRDPLLAIVNK